MRKVLVFDLKDRDAYVKSLLSCSKQFSRFAFFTSNDREGSTVNMIAAVDCADELVPTADPFGSLKTFCTQKNDWLFGFLSYDLKNEIENLASEKADGIGFPLLHFFQPKYVFVFRGGCVEIHFLAAVSSEKEARQLFNRILSACDQPLTGSDHWTGPGPEIRPRVSKEKYIGTIDAVKRHIARGDIYEMNYCMEFFSEKIIVDPSYVFMRLNKTSGAPFSAFYRLDDKFLMCASPERFLKKTGTRIIAQPIKGTARRGASLAEDFLLKEALRSNAKDRCENVMIVDLVRNDLSRTCVNVKVDELFGVYTFNQWHQMISTVSAEMPGHIHPVDVLKKCFPMGSMTGAPKIRAMELIEQYEKTKRGLYSGAVGYFSPDGDFDFNVVIRSILYNASTNYISFQAGSAITSNSIPDGEYEECLLKAKGMFEALQGTDALPVASRSERSSFHTEHA